MPDNILFYIFSALTLLFSIIAVTRARALTCVFYLVLAGFSTAGIFLLLGAALLSIFQILVSFGAGLTAFTLLTSVAKPRTINLSKVIVLLVSLCIVIVLSIAIWRPPFAKFPMTGMNYTSPSALGVVLLNDYLLALIFFSALLFLCFAGVLSFVRGGHK